ncbi:MAG: RNA-binding protein [candidate division Zixibacteria bacterium DG_27]|nr:MAG: RNA-binding protein [candidate division Zixibacteria bacterium DG_27]
MKTSKLYVGNLNYQTDEEKLRELFSQHGTVSSVNIIEGRGFGFVEMETVEAAEKAKEALDGSQVDDRSIRVDEARPKRGGDRDRGFSQRRYSRW